MFYVNYKEELEPVEIISVLKMLGEVETGEILDHRGRETQFLGAIKSKAEKRIGILYFPWKRPLGVNKITHSYRLSESLGFDGTIIVSNEFTPACIQQTYRINKLNKHVIALFEAKEILNNLKNSSPELPELVLNSH